MNTETNNNGHTPSILRINIEDDLNFSLPNLLHNLRDINRLVLDIMELINETKRKNCEEYKECSIAFYNYSEEVLPELYLSFNSMNNGAEKGRLKSLESANEKKRKMVRDHIDPSRKVPEGRNHGVVCFNGKLFVFTDGFPSSEENETISFIVGLYGVKCTCNLDPKIGSELLESTENQLIPLILSKYQRLYPIL